MLKLLKLFRRLTLITLWAFVGRSSRQPSPLHYADHIWKDSASRLGLRLTERLRDHWRPRWLRLQNHDLPVRSSQDPKG